MALKLRLLFSALIITLLHGGCKKKETETPSPLPTIRTLAISSIGVSSATGGGWVSSEGSSALSAVGICWDTNPNPTTLRAHTDAGAGTGAFQNTMMGLNPNTTYYVRAYATNASGTAYGSEVSFKTMPQWTKTGGGLNYAIACKGNGIFVASDKIYVSRNEGATYGESSAGILGTPNNLAVKDNLIFATTISNSGVFVSSDDGVNWTGTNANLPSLDVFQVVATSSALFVIVYQQGIFKSTDNGNSWIAVNTGLSNLDVRYIVANGSVLMAINGNSEVHMSTNSGASWSAVNVGQPLVNLQSLALSNTRMLISTSEHNYISSNNGLTWTKITAFGNSASRVFSVVGNFIFSSGGGNTFLSTDGGSTWSTVNHGLDAKTISHVAMSNTHIYALTYPDGIYKRPLQ